jgi:hypothetical protein
MAALKGGIYTGKRKAPASEGDLYKGAEGRQLNRR